MNKLVELRGVTKTYSRGREQVRALRGIFLTIEAGEFQAVVGPSGSGKTTLLQILGCVDRPTSGRVIFDGQEVDGLPEHALTGLRACKVGFVFQQFFLLPTLTAMENVELPGLFTHARERERRARELLERVGLSSRLDHRPSELSGGEMQRVAIARAMINQPQLLLADEPTGNLDSENARIVLELFRELNRQGQTIVMVTHNAELTASAHRVIHIRDGEITGVQKPISPSR